MTRDEFRKKLLLEIYKRRDNLIRSLLSEIEGAESAGQQAQKSEHKCTGTNNFDESLQNENLSDKVNFQEKLLLALIDYHTFSVPKTKSSYIKHYISASDGGFPLIKPDDPLSAAAKIRFHHNCGGPAVLSFIEKVSLEVVTSVVIGESVKYKNEFGHYNVPPEHSTRIVKEDITKYKPDIVLLMPNNVATFNDKELEELRAGCDFFLAARDGDPCSYQEERITRNLNIARSVDLFISVDGEFVETANSRGYTNVEYIPSFVEEHLIPNDTNEKTNDILFTGVGWPGELMKNGETMYAKRRRFISKVNEKFGERLKVYGHCWDDFKLANWSNDFISEDDVHQISGKTKIVIAYDGPYAKGFTSVRVFRALMSGAFVLIRYFPGIENIFENNKHLVWFHGDEEGLDLLQYYLDNDEERDKIAWMGKEFLLAQNGWRRKKIIVDYLINRRNGSSDSFSSRYSRFDVPRAVKPLIKETLSQLKKTTTVVNLNDAVNYAENFIEQRSFRKAGEILLSVIEYDENHLEALNDLAALEILNYEPEKSLEYIRKIRNIDYSNRTAEENLKYLKRVYGEEKITSSL